MFRILARVRVRLGSEFHVRVTKIRHLEVASTPHAPLMLPHPCCPTPSLTQPDSQTKSGRESGQIRIWINRSRKFWDQ